jgi:carbon monoxide dehydrogenase subunit G
MRSFTHSAHISRTPEHVFGFMTDFGNASRWMSLVKRLEFVGIGPAARGRQVLVTLDLMGKIRQTVSEMWSYDPPRSLGFRNTASGITGQFEYRLEPERDGTRITFTADIRPHGFAWLLLPFVLKTHRARYSDQLDRLKKVIEASPQS